MWFQHMPRTRVHCLIFSPRVTLRGSFSSTMFGAKSNPRTATGFQRQSEGFQRILGDPCYVKGVIWPSTKFLGHDVKPSPRDEHLGSLPACIFLWDAFSVGLMVKM